MSKPKVFVTQSDMPEPVLDILREVCEVDHWHKTTISKEELLEKVQGIDALFWCSVGKVDKEVLERAGKNLKVIATVSTGYDHIDVKEAKARGIRVGNSPNIGANTVAELTIGLLLATSHRILEVSASLRRGEWGLWCPTWMSGQDIHGSVVGIVGLGAIGQAVAKRLKAFDVSRILYCGRGRKQEVLTPHVGTATLRTRIGMTTLAARNIVACLQGKPMPAELL